MWADLIRSRSADWELEISGLARNFAPARVPEGVRIVIGKGGGRDAFTHDGRTIGFDVSQLNAIYGDATLQANRDRIDRFFRHEYVHLIQKAWLSRQAYEANTPIQVALLDIWTEGLGNYYSLSARWRAIGGKPSDVALTTLGKLEPRFVARLAALACGSPDAGKLTADLSEGPFDEKWGALPAALWLEIDRSKSEDALRQFVVAGPDGIWTIADRHLPEQLRSVLQEARTAAAVCAVAE